MNPQDSHIQPPAYQPPPPTPPPQQHQDDHKQRVGRELTVTQEGEVTICTITRHPIGIISIYVGLTVMLTILAVLFFGIGPSMAQGGSADSIKQIGAVFMLFFGFISVIYALIATKVYWGNSWVVTSDSITQISQTSLFNKESSQLALVNVEDVTSKQQGILTHIFNYGQIRAQTAGEHGKFVMTYCPNPNYYAQKILAAHEALGIRGHH